MNLIANTLNTTFATVLGHNFCHPPLPILQFKNKTVLINGFPILIEGDTFLTTQDCDADTHPSSGINFCTPGPTNRRTILVNGANIIITGDLVACGDVVGFGSNTTVVAY
jgi:uncharacterized Zn-binding protein involved in type VI secretion